MIEATTQDAPEKGPEQLPRIFQANLDRLFQRIIGPGMDRLPIHETLVYGETTSYDEFLDRCGAQVDNYLANEAAKAYALTLAAVFERQLHTFARRLWATSAVEPPSQKPSKPGKPKPPNYGQLLELGAKYSKVDLGALGLAGHLKELLLVGNVVRHGEGDSCDQLQAFAPHLWDYDPSRYMDLLPGPASPSETMRIRIGELSRYAVAAMTFWGHSDPLDFATRVIPGYGWIDLHAAPSSRPAPT